MSRLERWMLAQQPQRTVLDSPVSALKVVVPMLTDKDGEPLQTEHFVVVVLGGKLGVVDKTVISKGTRNMCLVDAGQIMRFALTRKRQAAGVIVAHNHPSGSAKPSDKDNRVTDQVQKACRLLNIDLLDHMIVGACGDYYSYREAGYLSATLPTLPSLGAR